MLHCYLAFIFINPISTVLLCLYFSILYLSALYLCPYTFYSFIHQPRCFVLTPFISKFINPILLWLYLSALHLSTPYLRSYTSHPLYSPTPFSCPHTLHAHSHHSHPLTPTSSPFHLTSQGFNNTPRMEVSTIRNLYYRDPNHLKHQLQPTEFGYLLNLQSVYTKSETPIPAPILHALRDRSAPRHITIHIKVFFVTGSNKTTTEGVTHLCLCNLCIYFVHTNVYFILLYFCGSINIKKKLEHFKISRYKYFFTVLMIYWLFFFFVKIRKPAFV